MKVIILAAGLSKRLASVTGNKSKALVILDGQTVLERLIRSYVAYDYNDFNIIVGHDHAAIEKCLEGLKHFLAFKYSIVWNPNYASMNNCYSLLLGIRDVAEDALISNSDIVFDPQLLGYVKNSAEGNFLVIDDVNPLDEEDMKVYLKGNRVVDLSKGLDVKRAQGEYIGISGIRKETLHLLKESLAKIVEENPHLYYEDAYRLLLDEVPFYALSTRGLKWAEIDTPQDLESAANVVRECS